MKIYCEHSADPRKVRELTLNLQVELVHFPYDVNSRCSVIRTRPNPSAAQIGDLNLPIAELPGTIADYSASRHFDQIRLIVGHLNRQDALHIDSAFKSGCAAFITVDGDDILDHAAELEALLGIKFFCSSEEGLKNLKQFIEGVPARP